MLKVSKASHICCIKINAFFALFCRSGQNTVELLAIADRRVAELNEEIRMLEKQVSKTTNFGNVGLRKFGCLDPCYFHPSAFTKIATGTSNSAFVRLYVL